MDVEKINKTNNDIFQAIGSLSEGIKGINAHLATLNGSVAKQQDKLAGQDVLNAQMTISQQQLVKDIAEIKSEKGTMTNFWYGVLASIGVGVLMFFLTK